MNMSMSMSITTAGDSLRHSIFGPGIDMLEGKDGVQSLRSLTLLLADSTWTGVLAALVTHDRDQ